jgi:hypothetical protein
VFEEFFPAGVSSEIDQGPVIEARAFEIAVVERESQGADQMEPRANGGGQPSYRAGVLWNFGPYQYDVQARPLDSVSLHP